MPASTAKKSPDIAVETTPEVRDAGGVSTGDVVLVCSGEPVSRAQWERVLRRMMPVAERLKDGARDV